MSNLAVRIDDGETSRLVTQHASGLRFRKTAPGGHHSASCRITLPASAFTDLGPADRIAISDPRTAAVLWEGYTENPGAEDGPGGQAFDLSALGGQVLTADNSRPVVFVDRALAPELWRRSGGETVGGTSDVREGALVLQFPAGIPVGPGSRVNMIYNGLYKCGQLVGSLDWAVVAGKDDAGYSNRVYYTVGSTFTQVQLHYFSTTSTFLWLNLAGLGAEAVTIESWREGGATNVADDLTWQRFSAVAVRALLVDASGDLETSFTRGIVTASEVVNHLLGAMLPMFDGAGALVETTATSITQLTYHGGATPRRVLDDLALFEPDHLWEVLESDHAGRHRFAYRAWPTDARYEISVRDGYSAPGGDADLCNRIVVNWTDGTSGRHSTVVTSTVPELGARERDAQPVTLPTGVGDEGDAQRIGQMVLAAKATPPKAARAVVRRPILDRQTGSMVMPWEIEPGYVVAVRETGDLLRLTEMDYDDDAVATTLTLGTPQRTIEQMLAGLGLSQGIAA